MRTRRVIQAVVPWCAVHIALAAHLQAQTVSTLHTFTGGASANPIATLLIVSNRIYGTSSAFYESKNGTVFAMNLDGSGFETLHSFSTPAHNPDTEAYTNSDGALPQAGLIFSGGRLYGTTYKGGLCGEGSVFSLKTDGTDFTNLYNFCGYDDGAWPWAPLILSGDTLYGTTYGGTIFAINTDGTGFRVVHLFNGDDGAGPMAGLILSGDTLYGTASSGAVGAGVVFKIKTDGTGYTNLHVFSGIDGDNPANAGLVLSGNTLYGTTFWGGGPSPGIHGYGTVFKLQIDGSGFTNLHSFTPAPDGTYRDGAFPTSGVTLWGDTLYGTAAGGLGPSGTIGSGTIFALHTDGTSFTTLHNFAPLPAYPAPPTNSDGAGLQSGLVISQDRLYGATIVGAAGYGTIFSISLSPPRLSMTLGRDSVTLSWPSDGSGFSLQTSANFSSSAAWTTLTQAPVVIDGQNRLTFSRDSATNGQARFYRLMR